VCLADVQAVYLQTLAGVMRHAGDMLYNFKGHIHIKGTVFHALY
jgi:hypothetical protein